jgi:DUF1365 family protein
VTSLLFRHPGSREAAIRDLSEPATRRSRLSSPPARASGRDDGDHSRPFRSAIYEGVIVHTRVRPRKHRLRYRIFWLLADIDELDALAGANRLFAHNRLGLVSFHDRDHGDRAGNPLRAWAERKLRDAGIEPARGPIELLGMPRILNHVFNPLSVWFCRDRAGGLQAIIYEVNNTFGQTHAYVLPVDDPAASIVDQHCDKAFHVSPLMRMDLHYRFRVEPPAARTSVTIHVSGAEGLVLAASFRGERRELTDANLFRAWLAHPLLSLKTLSAIHWEALLIWLKLRRAKRLSSPAPTA